MVAELRAGHVHRRLFSWHAESRRLAVEVPSGPESMTHLTENRQPMRWTVLPERQAICRSDDTDGTVMGIFSPGYAITPVGTPCPKSSPAPDQPLSPSPSRPTGREGPGGPFVFPGAGAPIRVS